MRLFSGVVKLFIDIVGVVCSSICSIDVGYVSITAKSGVVVLLLTTQRQQDHVSSVQRMNKITVASLCWQFITYLTEMPED